MNNSRTKNATRNIFSGLINKIIMLLFPFIIRTIMIKSLGSEFLGLNSLFSSLLQVLNLAELGFGSAVVFSLYKPIAKGDKKTICALLNLYKKIYEIIGIVIICVGICILPFLKYLINGTYPNSINLYIVFVLYLLNTAITYMMFAYKSSILIAHQRSDIYNNVLSFSHIIQYIAQIAVIFIFKNYYLYLIVNILATIFNNLIINYIVNKNYPHYICKGSINNDLKKDIKQRVKGLMIQKICAATRNSLDSIFISSFLGLNAVAIYSNYYTILNAVAGIMIIISNAILAGVGNSVVTESTEKNYNDMYKFNFIYMWFAGLSTTLMLCMYQPFMSLWMGEKYLLPMKTVVLICIYFYILKIGDIRSTYSEANGLWWEGRYRALFESIANILLNILLGRLFGLNGIILATVISLFIFNFIYSSQILFKCYFKNISVFEFYKKNLLYAFVTFIGCCISYIICSRFHYNLLITLIINFSVCVVVTTSIYFIIYSYFKEFKESKKFIITFLKGVSKNEVQ